MDVLRALCDFGRRIIGKPVVPGMQSGVAAADRIVFISPGVIIVRHFVQCRGRRAHALIFKRLRIYGRCRLGDQRFIGNVRVSSRGRLRMGRARSNDKQNDSAEQNMNWLHRCDAIVDMPNGKRKAREMFLVFICSLPAQRAVGVSDAAAPIF